MHRLCTDSIFSRLDFKCSDAPFPKSTSLAQRVRRSLKNTTTYSIDDYAKDGGEDLFTKIHCVLVTNP